MQRGARIFARAIQCSSRVQDPSSIPASRIGHNCVRLCVCVCVHLTFRFEDHSGNAAAANSRHHTILSGMRLLGAYTTLFENGKQAVAE
jgi:hypothetical protein